MTQEIEVLSEVTGTVWKVLATQGQRLAEGDTIAIIESMKMEIPVESPFAGTIRKLLVSEGQAVAEGAVLAVIERD
ncbi:biotin/lipoyl-binding carrier protein [Variovorax sp. PBL-E5]|uniref:biotin/lipoyl-binding carrier protein n=1 Tax=Variovorax sp. PBL-E5 TaxID=434014 RepID=UPI001315D493|nr:biotin/lipoyl-binding carrier protein [Variovorax sp. PBL-E5]VTU20772.1 Biotinylated protein TB7.3 [Variovorax sp. PBL-E5]